MTLVLRKLNDTGLAEFDRWLKEDGSGATPTHFLSDPQTSDALSTRVIPEDRRFVNRFEFGRYLNGLLEPLGAGVVSHDRGLWTWLALLWFDQICPPTSEGRRKIKESYRYILSKSYRHYYRHLVRTPWQIVRDHGENGRFLLLSSKDSVYPLQIGGEVLEQLAGRQGILRSRRIIAEASKLYTDPATGRPKAGAAGSAGGSARRLALVLQQFRLTFDPESMSEGGLIKLLPKEFDRWKQTAIAE